jgi:hypothetical protein
MYRQWGNKALDTTGNDEQRNATGQQFDGNGAAFNQRFPARPLTRN